MTKLKEVENTSHVVPKEMKVAYLEDKCKVNVHTESVPSASGKDVLIKVMAVGICGSDVHYYAHGRIGKRQVIYPHVQGHEFSGVVVAVGEEVTMFKVGDRVTAEPGVSCLTCEFCKRGDYNLCPDMKFLSTPPYKGAFTQYVTHREDFVFPIPDTLSFENATLTEPLSVGIHAVKRGKLEPGMNVFISGMEPVGLLTVLAAKALGAKEIVVSDMVPLRLETAKKLGATKVINFTEDNISEKVEKATGGIGPDIIIETSGNVNALKSAVSLVKRGSSIVTVGFPPGDVDLDVTSLMQKEADLITLYRYRNTFPLAINLLETYEKNLAGFITGTYPIDLIQDAMEQARTDRDRSLKIVVYPN